jgi:hypothetical protein
MKKGISLLIEFLIVITVRCQDSDVGGVQSARAIAVMQTNRDFQNSTFMAGDICRDIIAAVWARWKVKCYDFRITPAFDEQSAKGENLFTCRVVSLVLPSVQIDLQTQLSTFI